MTFFAIRGSRQLTSEEYMAHLALAIRLENVGVLLGAGASRGVGGMVMADVWALIENEFADQTRFLRDEKFLGKAETGNCELNEAAIAAVRQGVAVLRDDLAES